VKRWWSTRGRTVEALKLEVVHIQRRFQLGDAPAQAARLGRPLLGAVAVFGHHLRCSALDSVRM